MSFHVLSVSNARLPQNGAQNRIPKLALEIVNVIMTGEISKFAWSSSSLPKGDQQILALHPRPATTTSLVLAYIKEGDKTSSLHEKRMIIGEMKTVLNSLTDEVYEAELDSILDAAINLDKVISSQIAKISWDFQRLRDEEHVHREASSDMEDMVIVSPAMIKRGRSNGEDFDIEYVLLPREEELCRSKSH
ncbi:hypothetical protein M434DRAFT_36145 [Hypoxylon sp. CO27-5]|nr:hypothetical protein M434DRAFT_36145 [Hypoxylon sp. CO27-5]